MLFLEQFAPHKAQRLLRNFLLQTFQAILLVSVRDFFRPIDRIREERKNSSLGR